MFGWSKGGKFTLSHNAQRHLGQSEDCIFCVSLAMRTCNVGHYLFSSICLSIWHFLHSVETNLTHTLLVLQHLWQGSSVDHAMAEAGRWDQQAGVKDDVGVGLSVPDDPTRLPLHQTGGPIPPLPPANGTTQHCGCKYDQPLILHNIVDVSMTS